MLLMMNLEARRGADVCHLQLSLRNTFGKGACTIQALPGSVAVLVESDS
jgi:hypothetical protein